MGTNQNLSIHEQSQRAFAARAEDEARREAQKDQNALPRLSTRHHQRPNMEAIWAQQKAEEQVERTAESSVSVLTRDRFVEQWESIRAHVIAHTDAAWWEEREDASPLDLLAEAILEMALHTK